MNAEQQSNRERPRLEIDEKLGFILAVVAGALLSIAAGGWMILLSNITQLKSTFDAGEAQRFAQLGIMEGTIRIIQDKIEILTGSNGKIRMLEDKIDSATDKFRQMVAALKQSRDEASKSNIRLNKIEEDLSKARRRIPLSNSKASETPEARERR